MIKLLKDKLKNNKIVIILFLILISFSYVSIINYLNNKEQINLLENELKKEKSKVSDEQIIVNQIKVNSENINKTISLIEENEILLRKYKAKKKCWVNQMNRLIEGLEYNLDYCDLDENINKFSDEGL